MFCKWCGNAVKSTDIRCFSCGRETPTLSDCGGLYTLRTSSEAIESRAPTTSNKATPRKGSPRKNRHRGAMWWIYHTVMAAAVAALIAICIGMAIRIEDLEKKVEGLEKRCTVQDVDSPNSAQSQEPKARENEQ